MDVLEALAHYLEAQGHGEVGVNIFVNEMPESASGAGILIYTSGLGLQQHTNISGYYRGAVTMAVTNSDPVAGRDLAYKVFGSMTFEGKTLSGTRIAISKPEALPQSFGRNEGGHVEWLLSFQLNVTM